MMKNKNVWMLIGLVLFVLGITGLILQMVGVNWYFLTFLEIPGRLFAFVAKLIMLLVGVFILILANTDWERERRDSE